MIRELKLISPRIGAALIAQMAHELKNYNLYKSFANYFSLQALTALETYFNKRAAEEMVHHDWIFKYMCDADCRIEYPIIEMNAEQKISSIIDPFVDTVTREVQTTQMIYKIYEIAKEEKDYMTITWLENHLIVEQIEEENTSRMARAIMEIDADLLEKCDLVLGLLK